MSLNNQDASKENESRVIAYNFDDQFVSPSQVNTVFQIVEVSWKKIFEIIRHDMEKGQNLFAKRHALKAVGE
jgi:hypothetical protein